MYPCALVLGFSFFFLISLGDLFLLIFVFLFLIFRKWWILLEGKYSLTSLIAMGFYWFYYNLVHKTDLSDYGVITSWRNFSVYPKVWNYSSIVYTIVICGIVAWAMKLFFTIGDLNYTQTFWLFVQTIWYVHVFLRFCEVGLMCS